VSHRASSERAVWRTYIGEQGIGGELLGADGARSRSRRPPQRHRRGAGKVSSNRSFTNQPSPHSPHRPASLGQAFAGCGWTTKWPESAPARSDHPPSKATDPTSGSIKAPPKEEVWYDAEQTDHFLATARRVQPNHWAWWVVGFRAGLRPGEVYALRWQDIDLHGREVHVRNTRCVEHGFRPVKNNRPRTVPMHDDVVEALGQRQNKPPLDGDWVFEGPLWHVRHRLDRICKAADLPRITPHVARHSFASQLVAAGVQMATVAKLLGHQNIQLTFRTYSHFAPDTLADAIGKIGTKSVQKQKLKLLTPSQRDS